MAPGKDHIQQAAGRSYQAVANNTLTAHRTLPAIPALQKKENKTGMPDHLKAGVEKLSGISIDDVKVHYNSSRPAQLNALAYAQGTDIHIGPGQEKHLPHEAWHVVQQKEGRVKPTIQMKEGTPVNDDPGLEKEADMMGEKAVQLVYSGISAEPTQLNAQRKVESVNPVQMITAAELGRGALLSLALLASVGIPAFYLLLKHGRVYTRLQLLQIIQQRNLNHTITELAQVANAVPALSSSDILQLGEIHNGINTAGMIHIAQNLPAGRTAETVAQFANNLPLLSAQQTIQLLAAHGGVAINNILQAAITGQWQAQDNFMGRSNARIGVGEQLNLTAVINPVIPLMSIGGLQWTIVAGGGALAGVIPATGQATYTGPSAPGNLQLRLNIAAGHYAGTGLTTIALAAVNPTGAYQVQTGATIHNPLACNSGFMGVTYLTPTDVSFNNVEANEDVCNSTAHGSFVTAGWDNLPHPSWPWATVSNGNNATGSMVQGPNPGAPPYDYIHSGDLPADCAAGDFTWVIPWNFRVGGVTGLITHLTHLAVADGARQMTMSKGGVVVNATEP